MKVDSTNFETAFDHMKKSLKKGSFVGIDCEFSGTPEVTAVPRPDVIYKNYKTFCENHVVTQVGIAILDEDGNNSVYSVCVGPTANSFMVGSVALKFLADNDFDLNKWVTNGITEQQFEVIIAEVISARLTLVGFQCFIDLMLCFRHFIKPYSLPDDPQLFLSDIHVEIPSIIDIKHLVRQQGGFSLKATYNESCASLRITNKIHQSCYKAHDAGVDAYMTAVCYLLFIKSKPKELRTAMENQLFIYGAPFAFPLGQSLNYESIREDYKTCRFINCSVTTNSLMRNFDDIKEIHWLVRNRSALVKFGSVKSAVDAQSHKNSDYEVIACDVEIEQQPSSVNMKVLSQKVKSIESKNKTPPTPPRSSGLSKRRRSNIPPPPTSEIVVPAPGLRQMLQRRKDSRELASKKQIAPKRWFRSNKRCREIVLSKFRKVLEQKDSQIDFLRKGIEEYKRKATAVSPQELSSKPPQTLGEEDILLPPESKTDLPAPSLRQMLQQREEHLRELVSEKQVTPTAEAKRKRRFRSKKSSRKVLLKFQKVLKQKDGQIEIFNKGMEGYKREATLLRTVVEELRKKKPITVRPDSAGPLHPKEKLREHKEVKESHSVLKSSAAVKAEWAPSELGLSTSKEITQRRRRLSDQRSSSPPKWYETQPSDDAAAEKKKRWHELGPQLKKQNPRLHVVNGTWVISNFNGPATVILDCIDIRSIEVRDCSNIRIVIPNFHSALFQNANKVTIQIFRFVPVKGEEQKSFPNNLMTTEISSDVGYTNRQYYIPRDDDTFVARPQENSKNSESSAGGTFVHHFSCKGGSREERRGFFFSLFQKSSDPHRFVPSNWSLGDQHPLS